MIPTCDVICLLDLLAVRLRRTLRMQLFQLEVLGACIVAHCQHATGIASWLKWPHTKKGRMLVARAVRVRHAWAWHWHCSAWHWCAAGLVIQWQCQCQCQCQCHFRRGTVVSASADTRVSLWVAASSARSHAEATGSAWRITWHDMVS